MDELAQYLQDAGFRLEKQRTSRPNSLAEDFTALENLGMVTMLDARAYQLTGADKDNFLQGQVSQNIKVLPDYHATHTLFLNVKGQAQAFATVYRLPDSLLLVVEDGDGDLVLEHLQKHIIFDQVKIEPFPVAFCTIQGKEASSFLKSINVTIDEVIEAASSKLPLKQAMSPIPFQLYNESASESATSKAIVIPRARSITSGYDILVNAKTLTEFTNIVNKIEQAEGKLVGQDALEIARVTAGIPTVRTESSKKNQLPQAIGFNFCISYQKGCYLGQEIMARIEARGNIRHHLWGLWLDTKPEISAVTDTRGKKMGEISSLAYHPQRGWLALASLKIAPSIHAEADKDNLELNVGTVAARLATLPPL